MNLKDSKFKNMLYNILSDLNNIESSDLIMTRCVDNKLNASYESYQLTMRNMYNYVLSRSNIKVIKAINKIRKTKEIKNGSECN